MNSHENKCVANQIKSEKNLDKINIYNCLNLKELNVKIKEFILKYNMEFSENYEYIKINSSNNSFHFEIDKSIRGIFDSSKFLLNLKLRDYFKQLKVEDFYKKLNNIQKYSEINLILQKLFLEKENIDSNIKSNTLKLQHIELEYILTDIINQNKELK